ncbi:unnamed protein product [Bursaphelenchus xylophilus]|uniref:(pine wood nematode) hypothetical protein n=1 Tax=Bursaphelenchus xylophilus TaxID=6326 RepID=A0A1I7SE79_BURXY|nr:unnamed protein product [Bursaphelenchus xylophilus]CAG9088633.1 unnamed protein product [Bursaphelenchus xylophilus]
MKNVVVLATLLTLSVAQSDSGFALLDVETSDNQPVNHGLCVNFQQYFIKSLPTSAEEARKDNKYSFDLNWWQETPDNLDVCKGNETDLGGEIIPAKYPSTYYPQDLSKCEKRGKNESYYIQGQVRAIKEAGAAAALFILEKGTPSDFHGKNFLFSRFYNPKVRNDTPTFYMYKDLFDSIKGLINIDRNEAPILTFYRPADPFLDAGVFVLLALAVGCILLGCVWYVRDLRQRLESGRLKSTSLETPSHPESSETGILTRTSSPDSQTEEEKPACCHNNGVCCHLVSAGIALSVLVSILLLSFFFRSVAVEIFNIFLVIGGTLSICKCTLALIRTFVQDPALASPMECFGGDVEHEKWYLPAKLYKPFRPVGFMVFLLSLAFALTWYFAKDDPKAFYMLDLMNACICIYSVRSSEIRSLRFITFFLIAMFAYDIVMVFGTRLMTETGCSVMVQVVTGMDCQKTRPIDFSSDWPIAPVVKGLGDRPRKIPILFYVPLLSNPVSHCFDPAIEGEIQHMMLGLGDVIAPGYLIGFAFFMDVWKRTKYMEYGITTLTGYAFGMLATFISLKLMATAQPALIYLVPFTLIPLTLLCTIKGTLREAWKGAPSQ